jgi:type I restriction enzyme, R subunit
VHYRGGRRISTLIRNTRDGRQRSTLAEAVLWNRLRNRAFLGLKFRRQHQFLGFVLDFYCDELKLAIELDGAPHFEEQVIAYDNRRTARLQQYGLTVLRVENEELLVNPKIVFARIGRVVSALRSTSS